MTPPTVSAMASVRSTVWLWTACRKVTLAEMTEQAEEADPHRRSQNAAGQQHEPHLEIDVVAAPMGEHARDRGRHDLIGLGRHRHRRGYADEDQQRGQEEPAADPEQAQQK